jgi:hypothetical protein
MRVLLVVLVLSASLLAQEKTANPSTTAPSSLTNKDILLMHGAGLSDEVISEKIRNTPCDFDTSPAALADLKPAGISDSVVLEMIHCGSRGPAAEKSSAPEGSSRVGEPESLNTYTVSFVKSDRKWKFGFRSEPYDKISDYLQTQLVAALQEHGLRQLPALGGDRCLLTIELLEVTSHPAAIKEPGVDVTANLSVTDSHQRIIYSKGYRGESRTVMNTWGHLINHAVEAMAKSMANDDNLTRTLATGKL